MTRNLDIRWNDLSDMFTQTGIRVAGAKQGQFIWRNSDFAITYQEK